MTTSQVIANRPPQVNITSPSSGFTYDAGTSSSVVLSGTGRNITTVTWTNSLGGSGIATLALSGSTLTWSAGSIALTEGDNFVQVTCSTGAGTSVTRGIHITRTVSEPAPAFYVRTDGSDANDGSANDAAHAWLHIDFAASQVSPGDTIRVQAGTYAERVTPNVNGTSGNLITFIADGVVTANGVDLSSNSYLRFIGFVFDTNAGGTARARACVTVTGSCNFIEFWFNTFTDADWNGLRCAAGTLNNLVCIGNVAHTMGTFADPGSGGAYNINGEKNFVAYNEAHDIDPDAFLMTGSDGYLLNNYVHDMLELVGAHPDFLQNANDTVAFSRNVVEANMKIGAGTANDHMTNLQSNVAWTENIWRRNVSHNLGSGGIGVPANTAGFTYFRYYHDTDVDLQTGAAQVNEDASFTVYGTGIDNTRVQNNIAYQAWGSSRTTNIRVYAIENGSSIVDYNLAFDPGGSVTFSAPFSTQAHPRSNSNPNFVDYANDDFTLAAGSGDGANARGTGGPLTTTSGGGTGTTVNVAANSAGYFRGDASANIPQYSGKLVPGDVITIGTTTRRVVSISGDAITVDSSLTWSNGDPVYFDDDPSPDLGAYPYKSGGYALSATYTNSGGTVTVTPSDASLVRFVVFFSGGIPYAVANASPYTAPTPTGALTVQVFKRFASKSPMWVAATP